MNAKTFTTAALAFLAIGTIDAQASLSIADLVVADVTADRTQADPDEQIAVSCNVKNQRGQLAGASRLKYYFSTDPVLDGADRYLA